jgi:hypothetical protein
VYADRKIVSLPLPLPMPLPMLLLLPLLSMTLDDTGRRMWELRR